MREAANKLMYLGSRFESHPLNAIWAGVEAGPVQLQVSEMSLAGTRD
jgi:hypothetical protein